MADYPYTPLYYDELTTVKYYADGKYNIGLAYHSHLTTTSGSILFLEAIIQAAANDGIDWDDAIIELD